MEETEGLQCLGHSNWAICILLSHFCSDKFSTFALSYWGAHSFYPRGPIIRKETSPNSRNGWNRGDSVPGTFSPEMHDETCKYVVQPGPFVACNKCKFLNHLDQNLICRILLQGLAKRWAPGLVDFVPAGAYHLCLLCLYYSLNLGSTF